MRARNQYINVDITEKRAPTDESVRLLKEFEEKALEKLISSARLVDNKFEAQWHVMRDCLSFNYRVIVQYMLNGERYVTQTNIEHNKSVEQCFEHIRNHLAQHIACNVLQFCIEQSEDGMRSFRVLQGKML